MGFEDWLEDSMVRFREEGIEPGIKESGYELYLGFLRRLEPFSPSGQNIFEAEWDLLILLDSARVDAMRSLESDYPFLCNPDQLRSVGSASYQWMDRTFSGAYGKEMKQTAYITANHFSEEFLTADQFFHLEELWRTKWDQNIQTVPARPVTDAAIRFGRQFDGEYERCIVHYMQPHFPSVPEPLIYLDEPVDLQEALWTQVRRGKIEKELAWEAYMANLRYVLEEVELLIENFSAENVKVSADHANAFGEWGVYAHPNVPINALRIVPWYETTAKDRTTYFPPDDAEQEQGEELDMEERLRALGYR